jgi:hypothetical protein
VSERIIEKYLIYELTDHKPKTDVWSVLANEEPVIESGVLPHLPRLGEIKWYPSWRHYCFFPESDCVFSDRCLFSIYVFVLKLNRNHKLKKDTVTISKS